MISRQVSTKGNLHIVRSVSLMNDGGIRYSQPQRIVIKDCKINTGGGDLSMAVKLLNRQTISYKLQRCQVKGKMFPTLLSFYLADIPRPTEPVNRICYADDITVWASGVKIPELEHNINGYLTEMSCFLRDNSLLITAPKSTVTLFTTDPMQANHLFICTRSLRRASPCSQTKATMSISG